MIYLVLFLQQWFELKLELHDITYVPPIDVEASEVDVKLSHVLYVLLLVGWFCMCANVVGASNNSEGFFFVFCRHNSGG